MMNETEAEVTTKNSKTKTWTIVMNVKKYLELNALLGKLFSYVKKNHRQES